MDQKTNNGGTNSVKPQDGEQRAVGPIVHMRADSDSMLESMFNVALKTPGTEMPLQKPLRMRNLPPSFFKPPNMGTKSPSCHSRENSLDSTSLQDPYSPAMQNVGSPQPPQQQPIHINPVQQGPQQQGGPQQVAPPPPHSGSPGTAIHHSRAHSSPAQLVSQLVAVQVPLQQQVTTQQAQQQQQQQQQAQQQQLHRVMHSPHHRQASLGDNLGPLPPGWEETRTQDGQLYYMNHITKSTQWEDPRITLANHEPQNNHIAQVGVGANGPLPTGWEQGVTNDGEIYFIDHRTHRTQWHDPRIPLSQQVVPHRIHQGNSQQRLLLLQQKRKALQDKEAELRRMAEQARLQQRLQAHAQSSNSGSSLAEAQEMLMRQSLNEPNGPQNDPFLTSTQQQQQQQQQADLHNRQESADSGLGMGSNFNLGSIPEDIPGMESMDTGDLDTTLTGDSTPTAANTDHLMTTLPEALPLDDDIITLLNNQQRNSAAPAGSAAPGPHVDTSLTWL